MRQSKGLGHLFQAAGVFAVGGHGPKLSGRGVGRNAEPVVFAALEAGLHSELFRKVPTQFLK
jgi:hypothetical protein